MKHKFFNLAILIALVLTTIFTTPAYADEVDSTPEPVATSENAETPMPEAIESPVPERIDPAIASLSDEEQNGKFCKPPKPDCEYGEDEHGKCKPEPTKTATATKTEHPTQTSTRTPRPTHTPSNTPTIVVTPTQPSPSPTNSSTPTNTATITATATITQTPPPTATTAVPTTEVPSITPSATDTPSLTPTASESPSPTATVVTPTETNTATPTATFTATATVTATNTFVPTETPIVVPTETVAPTVTPAPTLTPVITPTTQVIEEKGEKDNDKKPAPGQFFIPNTGACTMDGEYIIVQKGTTMTIRETDGDQVLQKYHFDIYPKGLSPNDRTAAIPCKIYFSMILDGETQSDLYWIGFNGGAIHRVTNTHGINEMDPAIFGNDLSFTSQYDDGHVNVETTNLDGSNRRIRKVNAFAPAYDLNGMLNWSNSPNDENTGEWHTYSPQNTALTKHDTEFFSHMGEASVIFGEYSSAFYRPAGEFAVLIDTDGNLLITPVDSDWTPSGELIELDQNGLKFATWVDFGIE